MDKHCYKEYEYAIATLVKDYGFKYTGIGDNCEECFYKCSANGMEETIFVHPMFCSYYMNQKNYWNNRINTFRVNSDFNDHSEQKKVFRKLLCHLDDFSIPQPNEYLNRSNLYDWVNKI